MCPSTVCSLFLTLHTQSHHTHLTPPTTPPCHTHYLTTLIIPPHPSYPIHHTHAPHHTHPFTTSKLLSSCVVKEIFVCSCDLLVREMGYFAKYLMNYPRENWSRADISVHCDVSVFTWLMRYVKRGLYQDPFGNKLSQVQSKPPLSESVCPHIL